MKPKISIVVAAYNRAHSLPRSLAAIFGQTYVDFELLLVDDGSTDNTETLIHTINDSRLRYIKLSHNQGASVARNRGIEEARGEWVMVWDSDDVLYPEALETLMRTVAERPEAVVLSAPARMMKEEREKEFLVRPEGIISLQQVLCKYIGNNEKVRLARKDVYLQSPYVSRNIDFIVAARLAAQGEWYHTSKPLGEVFLDNPDSLTRSRQTFDSARSADRASHLVAFLQDFGDRLKEHCPKRYSEITYGTAIACACAGRRKEARHYAFEMWRKSPYTLRSYIALLFSILFPSCRN